MEVTCSICHEVKGIPHTKHNIEYSKIVRSGQNIIWKNDLFTILPDIGPLNKGHLLIVPNKHILSISNLTEEAIKVLSKIKKSLRSFNKNKFNSNTEFFEHGAGCNVNAGGACIVHAHMHAILSDVSVVNILKGFIEIEQIEENMFYGNLNSSENGYLYVEDIEGLSWINKKDIIPSQYLRKCYSTLEGYNDEWDWRTRFDIDKIMEIINNYSTFEI